MALCSRDIYGSWCHGGGVTLDMASQNRCAFAAGGDTSNSPVNGFAETEADVVSTSERAFLIGVAGGTASGKSTVCQKIITALGQRSADTEHCRRVEIISQECFYRVLNDSERAAASRGQFDFDHPSALDEPLMTSTVKDIVAKKKVTVPNYDFVSHSRQGSHEIPPADVILFEGILSFYFKTLRDLFDVRLFVDLDADTRLAMRVERDMKERERPLEQILHQYITYVKPAFEEFCLPTKKYADVIIPRGADNTVAIDLIVQHIQDLLQNGHNPSVSGIHHSVSIHSTESTASFRLSDEFKYTSAH